MGMKYAGELLMSVAVFAPGLILLSIAAVIGAIVGFEKLSARMAGNRRSATLETDVKPGRIVAELNDAVAQEQVDTQVDRKTGTENNR